MIRITVKGRGRFPIDMLRYDECYPASQLDATLISDSIDHTSDTYLQTWEVGLYSNMLRGPTEARWASFGVGVVTWETLR